MGIVWEIGLTKLNQANKEVEGILAFVDFIYSHY